MVDSLILDHEPTIRLGFFLGVLAAMAVWELAAPRRRLVASRPLRWLSNLAVVILGTGLLRLIFPILAVGLASLAELRGWGLFNAIEVPPWLAFVASLLVLDLAIYLQHVAFHAVPILWRVHMMHHADRDFDVTTGVRFHPFEAVLSMVIKLGVIAALGPPVVAVVVFEVVLSASSLFNHGNVRMPLRVDRVLRLIVVTPEMHRVHHSVRPHETNSNFRLQPAVVGPLIRNLPRPARGWSSGHDDRPHPVSRSPGRRICGGCWCCRSAVPTGAYPINRRGADT